MGLLAAGAVVLALAGTVKPAPAFQDSFRCLPHLNNLTEAEAAQCRLKQKLEEIEEKTKEQADKIDRLNMCMMLATRPSEMRDCHLFN